MSAKLCRNQPGEEDEDQMEIVRRHIIKQVAVEKIIGTTDEWTVEAIGSDGEIYKADFSGPDAEKRAREYALLKFDHEDSAAA